MSVKGCGSVRPQFVRHLLGTVETQKAQMGVLILMAKPTKGILDAVDHSGTYETAIRFAPESVQLGIDGLAM